MKKVTHAPLEGTYNFAQVLRDEREEIKRQCNERGVASDLEFDGPTAGRGPDTMGVAFSGGGIRSACVGMGILQRLAQAGMLRQTHYISAISGGGYLLGWLTAWTKRSGSLSEVEDQLGHNTAGGQSPSVSAPPAFDRFVEPTPIHVLRKYSSYLTPRVGLLSGDTLAMISVYLRNLFLNQLLLASALVCVILFFQLFSPNILWQYALAKWILLICGGLFVTAFVAGVLAAGSALKRIGQDQDPKEKRIFSFLSIACGVIASMLLWLVLPSWYLEDHSSFPTTGFFALLALAGFLLTIAVHPKIRAEQALQPVARDKAATIGTCFAAWFVFAIVASVIDLGFQHWLAIPDCLLQTGKNQVYVSDYYAVFGLPAMLLTLTFQSYLFIGILGRELPDAKREWLARVAGYFLLSAAVSSLLLAIALWGPLAIHLLFSGFEQASWRKYVITAVLPGGWLFVVLTGLLGANSAKTSGDGAKTSKLDFIIAIAPPLYLAGVLLLVSWGTHGMVERLVTLRTGGSIANADYLSWAQWNPEPSQSAIDWKPASAPLARDIEQQATPEPVVNFGDKLKAVTGMEIHSPDPLGAAYGTVFAMFFLIAVLLGFRLDVNEFSLNLFYRNRLVRAFLGASQLPGDRRPSPFTGFALRDDIALADLTMGRSKFQGPYPIWGTTLNLTAGEDLAWQQRKGASFIYSPLYCGWDYVDPKSMPAPLEQPAFNPDLLVGGPLSSQSGKPYSQFGFRATGPKVQLVSTNNGEAPSAEMEGEDYGGAGGKPYIGTAMAASGAAVSPNSGYHTRPGVAALLAIFNLRLGWWTGNPRNITTWKEYAPPITYLLAELMGYADDTGKYVYLSDGGHFENLGLYELVRRKVRFIICSDADGDPTFAFQDLGNAIDKCRRDFGVEIHLRAQRDIAAEGGKGFRSGHYAIGEIVYPGQTANGYLLYIKSSLTSDEPSDVLGMKAQDAAFPHDSTANQFFNESMFESYRALGQHMLDVILTNFKCDDGEPDKAKSVCRLFHLIRKQSDAQKVADALPKQSPLPVAVTGGVLVQVTP
jgi:hypothetical protein